MAPIYHSKPLKSSLAKGFSIGPRSPAIYVASAFIRGFSPTTTPLYDIAGVPEPWKALRQWTAWIHAPRADGGRMRGPMRALLNRRGVHARGVYPDEWQTFAEAVAFAEEMDLGGHGGVALILEPGPEPESRVYGGVFFVLPPPEGRPGRPLAVFSAPGEDS